MESPGSLTQLLYRFKAHHVLLWVGYYVFFMTMYSGFYPSLLLLFGVISVYFVFTATAFYFIAYYLFPLYFTTQKYGLLLASAFTTLMVLSAGLATAIYLMIRGQMGEFPENKLILFPIAFLSIGTISGILCAGKLIADRIRHDRSTQRLDRQRVEAELQYLKAQVNPHFLFNAINNIYFLIKKDPDRAAETLIRLSDLLRFQLYDCTGDKIDIESEVLYLRNFVALETIRKGCGLSVDFQAAEGLQGFLISPFLLIPFLENAFKHVSANDTSENRIAIALWRDETQFHARFSNTAENIGPSGIGGIGHKNVKRRLELLYPGAYSLAILPSPGNYDVTLSLKLL